MQLIDDWRVVIRRAWSLRLMLLAALLSGLEVVLEATGSDWLPGPKWLRMVVLMGVTVGAFVFRLLAQKSMRRGCDGH